MHRPPVRPRKYSWYSFLLEAELTLGSYCGQKDYVKENSNDTIRNQTRELPARSAMPQPTAPLCATVDIAVTNYHQIQMF